MRLVQKLIAAEKYARALEVVSTLHSQAALEGALKLANHFRWGGRGWGEAVMVVGAE